MKQRNFFSGLKRAGFRDLRARFGSTQVRAWNVAIRSQGALPRKARMAANVGKDTLLFLDGGGSSLVSSSTAFVAQWVKPEPDSWCSTAAVYESYCQTASEIESKDSLCQALKESGAERYQKKINGKTSRGWRVVLLKPIEDAPEELEDQFVVETTEEVRASP